PKLWFHVMTMLTCDCMGKRGGTRVIYYNALSEGYIWLLIAYTNAKFDNLPIAFLSQLKDEISHGQ
ncbi:hypothetical protein K4L93_29235, partial [Pseudomonas syringae pv. tomato]